MFGTGTKTGRLVLLQNANNLLFAETAHSHRLSPQLKNRLTSNRGRFRGAGHVCWRQLHLSGHFCEMPSRSIDQAGIDHHALAATKIEDWERPWQPLRQEKMCSSAPVGHATIVFSTNCAAAARSCSSSGLEYLNLAQRSLCSVSKSKNMACSASRTISTFVPAVWTSLPLVSTTNRSPVGVLR